MQENIAPLRLKSYNEEGTDLIGSDSESALSVVFIEESKHNDSSPLCYDTTGKHY